MSMVMPLGFRHSTETKRKMSDSHKKIGHRPPSWLGKKHTEEWKENMSKMMKGRKNPLTTERNKRKDFWTPEMRSKLSTAGKNRPLNLQALRTTHEKNIGKKRTLEQRMNISLSLRGNKSSFWKGGLTEEHDRIRSSAEYKIWRKSVFERDGYTCQVCRKKGGYIEADHIKPFSLYPELRFDVSNGRTLCKECHRKTDTFGRNMKKYEKI